MKFIATALRLSNKNLLMPGIHWVAKTYFKKRGYVWETRRNGEVYLGIWRKTFRRRSQKSSYPKRFVLIPGLGDTPLSWYGVMALLNPVLKMNYDEVILIDFPGFGGFLSREKSFPTLDLMMSTLNDTLDSLKPHTILGHSLGAWLTAHYAALCGSEKRPVTNRLNYSGPEMILLANPSGIFSDEESKLKWIGIFQTAMKEGFGILRPHLFLKEPVWFPFIIPYFTEFFTREDVLQFMNSFREEHVVQEVVHEIKAKVWLIWGEKDTLIPVGCVESWLKALNSTYRERHHAILVKNVGHSPHIEKPGITAAVIAQILTSKGPHYLGRRWWKVLDRSEISVSL